MDNIELELNDFTLTYFPKDRDVVVFSYGNIYQTETNFKIAIILKSIDSDIPEYFLVYINLKEIIAFSIGTLIKNQERTNKSAGTKADIRIDARDKEIEKKLLFQIPQLNQYIEDSIVPDKINKFNSKFHIKGQWYYILRDEFSGKNIYIPHYEVARRFYFTSPSMTRQILSAALEEKSSVLKGLYKNIEDIDLDTKEIVLTQNANTIDAENIYRFATNVDSFNAWHQIRRNLTASAIKIKEQKEVAGFSSTGNEMKLKVDFPVKEVIDIHARVKVLPDGSLLVLKILEEDTSYNFERLFVKIERKNKSDEPVGVINKEKSDKNNLSGKITTEKPIINKSPVEVEIELEERERKLGLEGKEVIKTVVKIESDSDVVENNEESEDKDVDLSSEDAESDGNENTTSSNVNVDGENNEQDEDDKDYLTLEDFKNMLFSCAQENKEFSYRITIDDYLPQKPEEDKDKRRKWRKAKLVDNETKRKYLAINITFEKRNFTIIEIQRDSLVKGLSSLIIYDRDNSKIDDNLIYLIAKNFVYENGRWLKDFGTLYFEKDFLEHPKGENSDGLNDWYKRLVKKLK